MMDKVWKEKIVSVTFSMLCSLFTHDDMVMLGASHVNLR